MHVHAHFVSVVLPQTGDALARRYPAISLSPRAGYRPLGDCALRMLVGLTGCGKSTTVAMLGGGGAPSRREVADAIAIPFAQSLAGETLHPVQDRLRRFDYTRRFAEAVPGGMATAFSWLHLRESSEIPITEGIRGDKEICHALRNFPRWRIIELALPPLERLRRLSQRNEAFDQADGGADLAFLPPALRDVARESLRMGAINRRALAILRAEARNYGLYPFAGGRDYPNYQRLDVAGMTPHEVSAAARSVLGLPCQK